MSKESHLGDIARNLATRERITEKNNAVEAEIKRPAKKIEINNPTITDDKERAEFLSKELKNMVGNVKYFEDLLKQNFLKDYVFQQDLFKDMSEQIGQIKNNLQAMKYSFPIYKANESDLDSLSNTYDKINIFSEAETNPLKLLDGTYKTNFDEYKEVLYDTLGKSIDHYSE